MKFIYKKVLLTLLLVVYSLSNAQSNGPGAPTLDPPSSPIDMYQYILGLVGLFIIGLYAFSKNKTQKI
ncbi:hypothetical protein [Chryseobacterium echinoideorum]|uniref:hypothetical protein n=1 Tax=Chryseobacterium echinoideorum TaxID=1549648 RepID=UPI0011858785|nr:hypothetical protein [Chryseobacterium echinoideorum]